MTQPLSQLVKVEPAIAVGIRRLERRVVQREFIATELQITRATVDTYRQRLSEKLGLKSRADLVAYALESGLLQKK